MRRNRILYQLLPGIVCFLCNGDAAGARLEERFDLETVEKHVLQPEYTASAEVLWCLRSPVEAYVMVGASVEAEGVNMILKRVRRKGDLSGDLAPLDAIAETRQGKAFNRRR